MYVTADIRCCCGEGECCCGKRIVSPYGLEDDANLDAIGAGLEEEFT
jgi:hypothetical protein